MPPARLYYVTAAYYLECAQDLKKAEDFYLLALSIASQDTAKVQALGGLAHMEWYCGDYPKSLQLARETYKIAHTSGNTVTIGVLFKQSLLRQ
jgi:hypothetical protein